MKVLVTLEQIKKSLPYLILTENDTIDLTKNIDISSNPSLKKLKNDAVTIGLQHNKGTKTRERGLELKKMLSSIEGLEDKEHRITFVVSDEPANPWVKGHISQIFALLSSSNDEKCKTVKLS